MIKTISVRAGKGLTMPIPAGIGVDTNERRFTDGITVKVVADDRFVRRSLANGDLVEVKEAIPEPIDAEAPRKRGKE